MPRGPVKTKTLCFMRVSTVSERPRLLHTSYSVLALKSESVVCKAGGRGTLIFYFSNCKIQQAKNCPVLNSKCKSLSVIVQKYY